MSYKGHADAVNHIQIVNERLYTASSDGLVKVWSIATGQPLGTLSGHEGAVTCVCVDFDTLFSASADRTVRAWSLVDNTCTAILRGPSPPNSAATSSCNTARSVATRRNTLQRGATRRNPAQAVATRRSMLQRGEQVTSAQC